VPGIQADFVPWLTTVVVLEGSEAYLSLASVYNRAECAGDKAHSAVCQGFKWFGLPVSLATRSKRLGNLSASCASNRIGSRRFAKPPRSSSPYNVEDPASQPYVTGVGGTTLYTGPQQQYAGEAAWNELALGAGATGGGISSVWKIPDYQKNEIGFANGYFTVNGGSNTVRNVPDVAAVGDPLTGVALYVKVAGGWISTGGTSVAAPIWAGYLSVVNAAYNWSGLGYIGFFNPLLYTTGASLGVDPDQVMYDVYQGSNGYAPFYGSPGYTNGPGYSNATGNGSIWGGGFGAQLITNGRQAGTPPGVFGHFQGNVSGDSVTFSWTPSTGATAYLIGVYHFGKYGFNLNTSYVTKNTKLTVKGLTPLPTGSDYIATIWAFNPSGSYRDQGEFVFDTK
jgi:subtilase family serine protease